MTDLAKQHCIRSCMNYAVEHITNHMFTNLHYYKMSKLSKV